MPLNHIQRVNKGQYNSGAIAAEIASQRFFGGFQIRFAIVGSASCAEDDL